MPFDDPGDREYHGSGGGLNSAGNRASGAGPGASSNRSTTGGGYGGTGSGGGLNSSGNRASGAGPGASSNRSTTGGGFSGTSSGGNSMGGGNGGGLNSAGNRASGAGPGASANRSTTGNGFGGTDTGNGFGGMNSPRGMSNPSLGGGMVSDSMRRADMAQAARASENASMSTYDAARALSQDNAARADLAQQARTAETQSMKDLSRERALGTISTAEVGVKDPYNTLSGGLTAAVTNMTVRDAIAFAKTPWQGKLANVIGAYQVKDKTLAAVAMKMGLMDAKMTPAVQDQIAVGLMQERANKATVNGQIDVDKFAKELAKEWASIATETGKSYYSANGIDKSSISYAKAREIAKDLVDNGVVSAGKPVSRITSKDVSSVQTNAPGVSRFSGTYMGGKVNSRTATAQEAAKTQQNDPSSLPPGTYRGYDPSGLPPEKPAAAAPAAPAAAKPRSLGQKVAAAGIDIGLGMLPGVGTAVSVINGGLALTGNRTLGERAVDAFADGKGGAGPNSGADRQGSSGREIAKNTSTAPKKKAESFEDRYLAFVDKTPRPTPAQRWDYNTPGYA